MDLLELHLLEPAAPRCLWCDHARDAHYDGRGGCVEWEGSSRDMRRCTCLVFVPADAQLRRLVRASTAASRRTASALRVLNLVLTEDRVRAVTRPRDLRVIAERSDRGMALVGALALRWVLS